MLRLFPGETGGGDGDDSAEDDAQNLTSDSDEEVEPVDQDTETEDGKKAPGPEEKESEEEEADTGELDDETLETIAEAYRDRLVKSKHISDLVSKEVRREVERQVSQKTRTSDAESRSGDLIGKGRSAAKAIVDLATIARGELVKAAKSEDFSTDLISDDKLAEHLRDYGAAVVAYNSNRWDSAIEDGWDKTFDGDDGLPALSDEQADELAEIVNTFRRMEGDPRQEAEARPYFISNLFKTLVALGRTDGVAQERARLSKSKVAADKIAGKNAVAAAKAKLSKDKAPPRVGGKGSPARITGDPYEEYDKAIDAGDTDRAQSIVEQLSKQGFLSDQA